MSDTMTQVIIRVEPEEKKNVSCERRFTKSDFEKYRKLAEDKENLEKCRKLASGRSYESNRKIVSHGAVFQRLSKPFLVYYQIDNEQHLFTVLDGIDEEEYMNESENMRNQMTLKNKEIADYNNIVRKDVIQKIKELKNWDDYVEFENKRYGLPNIVDKIHRTNDCLGVIERKVHSTPFCHNCENLFWGKCDGTCRDTYYTHTCTKCKSVVE